MFRQLVMPGAGTLTAAALDNINSLFVYHPLQISALIETVWLNRNNAGSAQTGSSFIPWSPQISVGLLTTNFFPGYDWSTGTPVPLLPGAGIVAPANFVAPINQPGIQNTWNGSGPLTGLKATNWDHMIFAYLVENTRIFEIFSKVGGTYMFSEQLETPSPASQAFWRNFEFLVFGDAMPSMVWTTSSRVRRDEIANRLTAYYWMFGLDLSHAAEVAVQHPYQKPAASNREFISVFESFCREIWRGIVNARNTSGANDTDATVIATLGRRIFDMMATRRLNGNLSREEFRAVAIMSFMQLALLYDSPVVVDLKATASSPEMRLQKMAERVGMSPHARSKPFFDLASPFSKLMQGIETGSYNDTTGAQLLFFPPSEISRNAEDVIDQYSLATGRDLKSQAVSITPGAGSSQPQMPRRPGSPPAQLAARQPDRTVRTGQ